MIVRLSFYRLDMWRMLLCITKKELIFSLPVYHGVAIAMSGLWRQRAYFESQCATNRCDAINTFFNIIFRIPEVAIELCRMPTGFRINNAR
jgi:hypothetical protein